MTQTFSQGQFETAQISLNPPEEWLERDPFDTSVQPADRNPATVYLASLASGSQRTMREALELIARTLTSGRATAFTLDWSSVRYQHAAALRSHLAEHHNYRYANKILSALRGVARECWRLELISAEDLQRICDVNNISGWSQPAGRELSVLEVSQFMHACYDGTVLGLRDAAIMAVCCGAGLRRSEAAALTRDDYDNVREVLVVRAGKGNKDRVAPLALNAAAVINEWLSVRPDVMGPLLLPIEQGGQVRLSAMSEETIRKALERRAQKAGVAAFSPHDLRRTFIGDAIASGADMFSIQRVVGHASPTTTATYDRRPADEQRDAIRKVRFPVVAHCSATA